MVFGPKGGNYGEPNRFNVCRTRISQLEQQDPQTTAHFENSISGPLVVIDKQANTAIPHPTGTNTLQDLEYWIYKQYTIEGVEDELSLFP